MPRKSVTQKNLRRQAPQKHLSRYCHIRGGWRKMGLGKERGLPGNQNWRQDAGAKGGGSGSTGTRRVPQPLLFMNQP
jgi:hypothetical protein